MNVGAQPFNDWKLVSLSPLPTWVLALLVIAVAVGAVLAILGVRREPSAARRWMGRFKAHFSGFCP